MRIGLIAPPWVPVPPRAYGGTEQVVDGLARGLQARGHEVVLFTVGTSTCPVRREYLHREPVEPMGATVPETAHVLAAYEALQDVDIIHDHTVIGPLVAGRKRLVSPPVVATNHSPFTAETSRIYAEIARSAHIVAISRSQARSAAGIPIAAVIRHGIDLDAHRPGPGDGGHLMFIGRMSPDKGVHHAIHVAKRAGRPIVLATRIREPGERAYFDEVVRPLLSTDHMPVAELPTAERLPLLGKAEALLNPICWAEPFGLVMAESLACGTPVLAFPNGSAPEIVDHGFTGFLCADEDEMVAALDQVPSISRSTCRTVAEQRFGLARMAIEHELLYRAVLDRRLARPRPAFAPWPTSGTNMTGTLASRIV